MDCKQCDSKKLFKVFDASKRKRTKTKRDGFNESNSIATDESAIGCQGNGRRASSAKASLQDILPTADGDGVQENVIIRERDSSQSMLCSPVDAHRASRSPRRYRRNAREGISLALKAGLVSTPRSLSPAPQNGEDVTDSIPQNHDSFIYEFLEDAIKRDKKKHRHSRRHRESCAERARDVSVTGDRRHRHHKRREELHTREKPAKEEHPEINQVALFETFAKLCAQMNKKTANYASVNEVPRSHSHKSLQCEVISRRDSFDAKQGPVHLKSRDHSNHHLSPTRMRSYDNCGRIGTKPDNNTVAMDDRDEKYLRSPSYEKQHNYSSRINVVGNRDEDRYRDYAPERPPTRNCNHGYYRRCEPDRRIDRGYEERRDPRQYDDRKRTCEHKTSRSFDVHRNGYVDDNISYRRTGRSDGVKENIFGDRGYREGSDRRYEERISRNKYYDVKDRQRNFTNLPRQDLHSKRNLECFDRISLTSKDEIYKNRERYSEREKDSSLCIADGDTSTISGRSNYLRVVKQEISEQREAMDKMMKLWKELMRCFKDINQTQVGDKTNNESTNNVRESAAAQLRLWRECMRRYETVARDVGDTDARLMEEINKQRSEMSEMANMWQECLQRYRDMSNDFNSLKQQLATSESPTRPAAPPLVCAEGEGPPIVPYRLPQHYPLMPPIPPGYAADGSPLRSRASAPPAWWWTGENIQRSPRRRSSPESHGSRERRHRQKDRDRDDSRYKEKSSKPSGARSEHRHRKR